MQPLMGLFDEQTDRRHSRHVNSNGEIQMPDIVVSGVRTVETHWVPLSDGRRLAARLFLPDDCESHPVPLLLEYIPYRRRDGTRLGDEEMHLFFAARGSPFVRVDIAGTGDSDGLLGRLDRIAGERLCG